MMYNKYKITNGWRVVGRGKIRAGDRIMVAGKFVPILKKEIGEKIDTFFLTIRKKKNK